MNRKPITTIEEANVFVTQKFKASNETLWISNSLNDQMGLNMAIILDGILKKGYFPNGFEEMDGYRIYKYKKE